MVGGGTEVQVPYGASIDGGGRVWEANKDLKT